MADDYPTPSSKELVEIFSNLCRKVGGMSIVLNDSDKLSFEQKVNEKGAGSAFADILKTAGVGPAQAKEFLAALGNPAFQIPPYTDNGYQVLASCAATKADAARQR